MFINSYKIAYSENKKIELIDRNEYMTSQYINVSKDYINNVSSIDLNSKTAFLYAAGPAIHHSDARDIKSTVKSASTAVKSQIGYNVYNIARMFKNIKIDYISTNANTCASSMFCIHEAKKLIDNDGFTDVIIFASDIVDDTQELLFKQLGVDIKCGDGLAIMHITSSETKNSIAEITNTSWCWNLDSSPMAVSEAGYNKVIDELCDNNIDSIKVHGSGTARNDEEEIKAISKLSYDKIFSYKSKIGHTQGVSALLELCLLIEEEYKWKNCLVLASGLGGFYGGCVVNKRR